MNINNVSLPYPVLGLGDNVYPIPMTNHNFSKNETEYSFEFDFEMHNAEIQNLIDEGKAEYVCEVNCVGTFLRFCVCSREPHLVIKLKRKDVINEITFFCTIAVKEEIKGYTNDGFHDDYEGYSFDLGRGDILAFFGEFSYDVGLQYELLHVLKQLMVIKKGHDGDDIKYNLATDKIEILLPPNLYNEYKENIQYKKSYSYIMQASLVFNSLMYALYNIDENRNTLWARSIEYRIANEDALKGFDIDESEQVPALVSAILKNPYSMLFDSLKTLTGNDDEEE